MATPAEIQQLFITYFGRPADPSGQSFWTTSPGARNASLLTIANGFATTTEYQNSVAGLTLDQVVNNFYLRLFGRAGEPAGIRFWVNQIQNGNTSAQAVGVAIGAAATGTDLIARDSKIASSTLWTTETGLSTQALLAYSGTVGIDAGVQYLVPVVSVATIPTPVQTAASIATLVANNSGSGGQTFTLTTAIEIVPAAGAGMQGNSTVNGVIAAGAFNGQTFQTGDIINGNATSALNVTVAAAVPVNVLATVNNMGAVNFRTFAALAAVNNILFNGVGSVNSLGSTELLTIQNGELASVYGVINPTAAAGGLTVGIRNTDLNGANDTLRFAVTGAIAGTALTNADAGVENVSVATIGNNSFSVRRAADARDGVLTITGAGTNTVDIGAELATNATFIGTGGTNTLVLTATPAFSTNVTLTDFAALTFGAATTSSILFAAGSTTPVVNLLEGDTTNVNVSGLGSIATINLVGDRATGDIGLFGAFSVNGAYTGTADTVAINVGNGGRSKTGAFGYTLEGDLILNGAETINVTVADIAATGVTTLSAGSITSNTLSTFTVVTPGNLIGVGGDIAPGATTLSAVNFSGVAGTANVETQTFNMANGGVITGSVRAFRGTFNGLDTAASTYTFNGNAAIDTVSFAGSAGRVNINTFAGNDVITAADGGGVITPGVGVDTVNLGAGADTVRFTLGDSGITATTIDTITDFTATAGATRDTIGLGLFNGSITNFGSDVAADHTFAEALADANTLINGTGVIYAFVRGANANSGFIFADYDGNDVIDFAAAVNGTNIAAGGNAAVFTFANIIA